MENRENPWKELSLFQASPGWYLFANEHVEIPIPYVLDASLKWFHIDLDPEDSPLNPEFEYTHFMPIPKIH